MQDADSSRDSGAEGSGVTAVVLAYNEEANIRRCLNALKWCDECVVVDDHSTDRTRTIAAECGARVVSHKFESFADQRNWAMRHADIQSEWVLHLDADEVSTDAMEQDIRRQLTDVSPEIVAFRMCRKTMFGKTWLKYSDGFPVWIMRLVRRDHPVFRNSGHGEVAVPEVDGEIGTIREPFLHYAFSKGLANWIDRHNRYSSREAELEAAAAVRFRWKHLVSSDRAVRRRSLRDLSRRLPFRPMLRFLYQFVLKRGFLDGRAGWAFSQMMATYEGWIVSKKTELLAAKHAEMLLLNSTSDNQADIDKPSTRKAA